MLTTRRRLLSTALLGAAIVHGLPIDMAAADELQSEGAPLSQTDRALLIVVAETLIPRTATPGATDVGVIDFIEFILRRGMQPAVRLAFQRGLQMFATDASKVIGKSFGEASAQQRFEYVDGLDAELFAARADAGRKPLLDCFATVKRLAVIGYFTSERGAKGTLDVQLFPGPFQGSKPVDAHSRSFYEDSFGVPAERPVGYL